MRNFPFGTNGKSIILGVPILKQITVHDSAKSRLCQDIDATFMPSELCYPYNL